MNGTPLRLVLALFQAIVAALQSAVTWGGVRLGFVALESMTSSLPAIRRLEFGRESAIWAMNQIAAPFIAHGRNVLML